MIRNQTYCVLIFLIGVIFSGSLSSCGNTKNKGDSSSNSQEISVQDRNKPDEQLIYKNNFYEAIRMKTVGDFQGSKEKLLWCKSQNPEDDAVLFLLAGYAKDEGKFEEALNLIKGASQIDPNNIWYTAFMGELLLKMGLLEEAELSFSKLSESDYSSFDWLNTYALVLSENRKIEKALATVNRIISIYGPSSELVKTRMDLRLLLNQELIMIDELRALILTHPNQPGFAALLLSHYQQMNQLRQAELDFIDVVNQNDEHSAARLALARLYLLTKQSDLAYNQLVKALNINALGFESYLGPISEYLEFSKDPTTLELINLLKERFPEEARVQELSAKANLTFGDKSQGKENLEKAVQQDPNNIALILDLLDLYAQDAQFDKVLETAENGLSYFPNQAELYWFASMASHKTGKLDQALDYLNMGLDFVINNPNLKAEFLRSKAEIYLTKKDMPNALKQITEAASLNGQSAEIQELYGDILYRNNQVDEALTHWKSARDLGNNSQRLEMKIKNKRID